MDERAALDVLADRLPTAGDDCAVVDGQVLTTDMLHATTDFPEGTTRYTAGWRAIGASLSDVASMGAAATATVAVYGAPTFDEDDLLAFVDGAADVCDAVEAEYVGGDLDSTDELTIVSTALGRTDDPVLRSGAEVGDAVCVTGTLGRSAAAFRLFERGDVEIANDLYQFLPRVAAGVALREHATAMMDSSDGLARSLHQLAEASGCGFAVESPLPIDPSVDDVATDDADRLELGAFFGEDFELVCTMPESNLSRAREEVPCELTRIGTVTESGVTLDGDPLPDRGWTH
ncbi:thiamine-phosphate kinase [Halomicrobium zhouii]|uniref:Thiamine-monophosphate kinase n=1 Tax=Halomicrobium zhouii TaxID=767519 RepID=A0A1I6KF17_9EURY|nr:thiamine-phosphate kinase [Halomicrobium zhouii]SFR89803.1 thiamine-phosphate kinase [Halomicrobium zhouii]